MPSSKNQDYVVEKILSKRTDGKGRISYLIQWKGYSEEDNTWEPENHLTNCPDIIKAFKNEEGKKNKLNTTQDRKSDRATRSSLLPSKTSTNTNARSSRSSTRPSSTRKRASVDESIEIEDEDEDEEENNYNEKKPAKRARKNTTDTDTTPSIDSYENDVLDTGKLDEILDVRRNRATNTIEYKIQTKKMKNPIWIKSERLTEEYTQQVVDFLEEKYV